MKTLIVILLFAVPALACKTGEVAYEGVCAADLKPEGAATTAPTNDPKIVSAEKPRKGVQPEWEVGLVHADMTGGPGPQPECAGGAPKVNGECK